MTQAKARRVVKRQLGQFFTPRALAEALVAPLHVSPSTRVLEPGFGDGSFILPLIRKFVPLYEGPTWQRLETILNRNVFGVEIDERAFHHCMDQIHEEFGFVPSTHNLVCADFFRHSFFPEQPHRTAQLDMFDDIAGFDLVIGNPPFGGTIDSELQDKLDRVYGLWNGEKIKKETYSLFLVKSLNQLKMHGRLLFICSDTFLTIPTMRGLRKLLMERATVNVRALATFSAETSYPMVVLDLEKNEGCNTVEVNGQIIDRHMMALTGNFSWAISEDMARYFAGPKLGDFVICSSGMTIGKNALFVREIVDKTIVEPYDFEFFDDPISLEKEFQRARLNKLSAKQVAKIRIAERSGQTRRNVRIVPKACPETISLPHPDYRFYNKASRGIIYTSATHAVYWKHDGEAVLTFKRNGNWYLHGVGGQPYFGRSGLSWQLVASRLNMRLLPRGYILDSGAPCAFLRPEIDTSELLFILGWACTDICSRLLKTVINHTMNIQSKDVERLPYPFWVPPDEKAMAIDVVDNLLRVALNGTEVDRSHRDIRCLETLYAYPDQPSNTEKPPRRSVKTAPGRHCSPV